MKSFRQHIDESEAKKPSTVGRVVQHLRAAGHSIEDANPRSVRRPTHTSSSIKHEDLEKHLGPAHGSHEGAHGKYHYWNVGKDHSVVHHPASGETIFRKWRQPGT